MRFDALWAIGMASRGKPGCRAFQNVPPGQKGRRHAPFAFLKLVISTADSAMNMIITIMTIRAFIGDGCATGAG